MNFYKKNLIIILLILFLIIYFCDKYLFNINLDSNINQEIINNQLELELKLEPQIESEVETQINKKFKWVSINNYNDLENQYNPTEELESSISITNTLINSDLSTCNINIIESNDKVNSIKSTDSTNSTNSCKINGDGSDLVNYNYVPKIVEGFENLDKIKAKYPPIKTPRYIWVYWENINRPNYPTHIKLFLDTIKLHLGTKYKLVILNEKTISQYLPDLRDDFFNLMVAQKVDYYRIALLYKYGGIWLDADIIVMKDLEPIFKKLDEGYDYVGFGCTGYQCSNGKFKPSNWVMGARPQSVLMELILSKLDTKLNLRDTNIKQSDDTYHDYGKMVIWEALDDLKQQGYDYYHFTSEYDGTRDSDKYWVHTPNFFNTNPTKLLAESKVLFIVFYNSEISPRKDLHWIRDCDESQLLYSKLWLGELYRKALGII